LDREQEFRYRLVEAPAEEIRGADYTVGPIGRTKINDMVGSNMFLY
jgi:hypothetical protein